MSCEDHLSTSKDCSSNQFLRYFKSPQILPCPILQAAPRVNCQLLGCTKSFWSPSLFSKSSPFFPSPAGFRLNHPVLCLSLPPLACFSWGYSGSFFYLTAFMINPLGLPPTSQPSQFLLLLQVSALTSLDQGSRFLPPVHTPLGCHLLLPSYFLPPSLFSHIMSEYGRMTDAERDQIDQDAQIFMRTCSEAIQQLRTEGKVPGKMQTASHECVK